MEKNKKIVVKIGTKVITSKDRALDRERIKDLVYQIADVMNDGTKALLVTSGAIAAGMWLLNKAKRPSGLSELQATAAIGQSYLMQVYAEYFKERGYLTGQILLTQEDFSDRKRYLNIKHTIDALLAHNAVPIINENDTVATEEIKCGDNDRLSGLVADLCGVDKLIILTDVDGLLDREGNVIPLVASITPKILKLGGKSTCDLGTGGMAAKIASIRTVTQAGIDCVIANGSKKDVLAKITAGHAVGTIFKSQSAKLIAKKRWIAFSTRTKGAIVVDEGAKEALREKDKSLLASGILDVKGIFTAGDAVRIMDLAEDEFARGVANYSSDDIRKVRGLNTENFKSVLGFKGPDEVVHKDNLVIL